jgi:flagellum-specific peptidoglycan hydrolase FlgJ
MKKIIILFLVTIFLMSCGTKKATTYKKPQKRNVTKSKPRRYKPEKVVVKPIKEESKTIVRTPLYIDINENKTVFDKGLLDAIYGDKPNLSVKKINYIKKYSELAIHEMEVYKIPASITLAQGLLESRYGQSALTKKAKNHFGIKCHKWQGERVYHDDDKKGECFRKYQLDESSYRDHSLFLSQKKRYATLFTFAQNDYKSWAKGLRKAGYATDKKYPQKLITLIEQYKLYYFDNLVLGEDYVFDTVEEENEINEKGIVDTPVISSNDSEIHIVKTGETLYSISKITNVSIKELIKWNDLVSNDLKIGQALKLYKITEINIKDTHVKHLVKIGDTLYSIAKNYNIPVSNLIKLNKLESNEISIGQVLLINEQN